MRSAAARSAPAGQATNSRRSSGENTEVLAPLNVSTAPLGERPLEAAENTSIRPRAPVTKSRPVTVSSEMSSGSATQGWRANSFPVARSSTSSVAGVRQPTSRLQGAPRRVAQQHAGFRRSLSRRNYLDVLFGMAKMKKVFGACLEATHEPPGLDAPSADRHPPAASRGTVIRCRMVCGIHGIGTGPAPCLRLRPRRRGGLLVRGLERPGFADRRFPGDRLPGRTR
jgi:hypothetical protein